MPVVHLGNPSPRERGQAIDDGERITTVVIPDFRSIQDALRDIAHDDGSPNGGLWTSHSGSDAPSWVSCPDSPELETAVAEKFGCRRGRPEQQQQKAEAKR